MLELNVHWQRDYFRLTVAGRFDAPVTGVIGRSGAGKSSLLNLIAGTERPEDGRIVLDGDVLFDRERRRNVPAHRRRIATVFQDGRLFPHLTVEGNLRYGQRRGAERHGQALPFDEVVELLALSPFLSRRPVDLSGGERQRVALGRALLSAPRLLLLDEPLVALDVPMKRRVLPFLRRAVEALQAPVIYVSHDVSEVLWLTSSLLVLDQGRVAGLGHFMELIGDATVFRLARDLGLDNVLPARVLEQRPTEGLSTLELIAATPATPPVPAPTTIVAPLSSRRAGERVLIGIRPEDIALATRPIEGISIQNQIVGRVARVRPHADVCLVEVNVGVPLLAEVSPKSAAELGLAPGRPAFLLFKAQGVRYLDEAGGGD